MYAGLPLSHSRTPLHRQQAPEKTAWHICPLYTYASLLFEEDGAPADSFPDNTADLQELFKLLEGTSHVEHQSVSR